MTKQRDEDDKSGLLLIGQLPLMRELEKQARRQLRAPTHSQQRIIDAASQPTILDDSDPVRLLFQHATLCQTFLPYRNPGDEFREWERKNGFVHLKLLAGEAWNDQLQVWVKLGLPYGPKARLILFYINQLAILSQSPVIEVESSLTAFARRTLGLAASGHQILEVKDQLARIAACQMRFGGPSKDGGSSRTVNSINIVQEFFMWSSTDKKQQKVNPHTLTLSPPYWLTLKEHAVPLHEHHIAALSHSGMALDVYAWLAHRLHRVPAGKPALITWPQLHEQFGGGRERLDRFRDPFRVALKQVLALYRDAKIDDERGGLRLHHSPPAVKPRVRLVKTED
jgi:hypothetical protein